jgi:outer membrane receptor protein involved in Fe transport
MGFNPTFNAIKQALNKQNLQGIALSSAVFGGMAALPVLAEEQDTQELQEQGLERIVVTSRKRVENIQKAPVSILAFDTQALQDLGIENFDDYALMLPSLSYQTVGPGLSQIYMRGASDGGDGNASGSQPSVATYFDEQPVTAIGRNFDLHIYDIERVEALAGPQSTLYGASSQTGTLRIITNKPDTSDFEAGFDLGYGSTKEGAPSHSVEGFINLPIADNAAIRLVAWTKEDGGYIDNVAGERTYGLYTNGGELSTVTENNSALIEEDINELTNSGLRAALRVELNDDWAATVSAVSQTQETEGVWFHDPENPSGEIGDLEVQRFNKDAMEDKFNQLGLTLEGDLGFANITYAGSFMDRDIEYFADYSDYTDYYSTSWVQYYGCEYYGTADVDCTSMNIMYQEDNELSRDTHELRLQSNGDDKFNYTVGFYFEESTHKYRQEWVMPGMAKGADFAQFGEPDLWYLTDQTRSDEQTAIFGELSYDVSDKLTLTAGGRYFKNESSLEGVSGYGVVFPGTPILAVDSKIDDSDSIFKLNATYQLDDDKMVYLTWSEGYRPGGINRDETDVVPREYKADFVTNFEFGWKTQWLDDTLRFNGALYTMQWDDMQLTRYDASYGSPVGLTINVAESEITGIESAITYLLTPDWTLSTSFSYNQAQLSDDVVVGSNSSPKGTELPNVPTFKGNIHSRYNFMVGDFNSFAQLVYSYVDESSDDIFKFNSGSEERQFNDCYSVMNFRVGLDQETWGVDFYINNLTDERAELTRGGASWDTSITTNRPRTLGVKYRMRF